MFGRKKRMPIYRDPISYSGRGVGKSGWVWRSFKKMLVTVLLVGMLAGPTLLDGVDEFITGKISLQDMLVTSYIEALQKGFHDFIPNILGTFTNLMAKQPAHAIVMNMIPMFLMFSAVFLWISIIADVLDMQKHEAIPSMYVFVSTLIILFVFSLSAIGFEVAIAAMGG